MTIQVKVSSKHQIALPVAVRHQLEIDAGDHLLVEVQDGVIVLIPMPADPIEEPKGLGREIWEDVNVQDCIDGERSGW